MKREPKSPDAPKTTRAKNPLREAASQLVRLVTRMKYLEATIKRHEEVVARSKKEMGEVKVHYDAARSALGAAE